ncbi:hypothetical protein OGAPHI_002683 [Ogataea philodendri]|uniref:rRNA-processing protein FYV7 n=1 Tax=Ogataea philodendri TaxID=1378263 RepID=A0A9P8T799_9ASCO|nr:uncharacterized protein OGAPHI_002683 [Ogataea philodendri]KAH3668928.1 hypothetical protein OGAPHI_002683 [Ogataea philodendri]
MSKKYDRDTKSEANLRRSYFKLVDQEKQESAQPRESKGLSFQDRLKLKHERKERKRQSQIEKTRKTYQKLKESEKTREVQSKKLQKAKTRTGQPLMAPRINNLLDKIKSEVSK